jgi:hypothetical protein
MMARPVRRSATLDHIPVQLIAMALLVAALVMIQVPAAAQEERGRLVINAANCEHEPPPDKGPILGEQGELPEYCEYADGFTATAYDVNGNVLGTCTTNFTGFCEMDEPISVGTEVVVEADESTVKPGYAPIENPFTGPFGHFEGTSEYNFVNVPSETSGLPNTGAGSGAEGAPGNLTPGLVGLLAVLGVIHGLGGAVLRRTVVR